MLSCKLINKSWIQHKNVFTHKRVNPQLVNETHCHNIQHFTHVSSSMLWKWSGRWTQPSSGREFSASTDPVTCSWLFHLQNKNAISMSNGLSRILWFSPARLCLMFFKKLVVSRSDIYGSANYECANKKNTVNIPVSKLMPSDPLSQVAESRIKQIHIMQHTGIKP